MTKFFNEIVRVALSGNVPNRPCDHMPAGTVTDFEIYGCDAGKPCSIVRGDTTLLKFDYISSTPYENPSFDMAIRYKVGSVDHFVNAVADLPHFEQNACKHTKCPLQAGVKQTLYLNQSIPHDFHREMPLKDLDLIFGIAGRFGIDYYN
ncbi:unnamed protein product [Medioppia subpectinata]|uniref:MD-2-related lipid-recognition domain-containing protein n=1 Tax=Medioppia subpectinata TaxID=1979941 RepID=A0A7R9KGG1_9ACAR|nr:unnamed protein product [Medioppia subpectinata]CAG2103093.1 unnamed protein product [Medioppia subpectinata]